MVSVDGVTAGGHFRGPGTIDYNLPDRDLFIGGYPGLEGTTFQGDIDEVAVYDRVLSGDEIWYSYLNESTRRCKGPSAPTLPTVSAITAPLDPTLAGASVLATAHFSDAGVTDTHTATWNWGDGSTSAGGINESGGSGLATGTHAYAVPGVYRIRLTVTDQDMAFGEATFEYLVTYDPGAGFVTGGGWITSPTGAYSLNPELAGKASFGFVSKYQSGANAPIGDTQFLFHAADMKFKSTSYQWLVVAGTRAQFKGEGSINGVGGFRFLLTAIDGQNKPGDVDRFRIKIWDTNTSEMVYDNQTGAADNSDPTTTLGGGSIVIHK